VQGKIDKLFEANTEGHFETAPEFAQTASDFRHINGQHKGLVTGPFCALDQAHG
jgi:hypothetical protein